MLTDLFHPQIAAWFKVRFKKPTEVQSLSWPEVAAGQNLLITAPTGSGKTLTAFLWALNEFCSGTMDTETTRVLYISPLKALNNDIQRNLLSPLAELKERFNEAGESFPDIRVETRSGDTPQAQRQRMLRKPPAILISTPESLSLMLTNQRARQALSGIRTVIFDEIHSIADNRRGVQLMVSAERLAHITNGFQRIALSATIRPLDTIAKFVAGFEPSGSPRSIKIIQSKAKKKLELKVIFPEAAKAARNQGIKIWEPLTDSFLQHIRRNTSTLLFTNNRALAEKITLKINADEAEPLAYAHHGSLAREIRAQVESRLKAGELKAIVATNSLEMGIDIGALDEVILIQSPPSIASTLQRIGRAGHAVGETSRGALYPTHPQDFVEAAALSQAVMKRDIEPIKPLQNALDVLAQTIVSMTATETWDKDEVYRLIKCSYSYHSLSLEMFDLVVEMLAGRYQQTRVRNLKTRLQYDRINNTLDANRAALFALYNSGGTIPDRSYYKLRHAESGSLIGELDEEFVWEARVGQNFALGSQHWRIQRITHNDVLVSPSASKTTPPPFWKAESLNRNFHLSELIGIFLADSEQIIKQNPRQVLCDKLMSQHGFDSGAASELTDYLCEQREKTASTLPHRHHLLLEHINAGPGGYHGVDGEQQLVFHTLWGGMLNQPFALALSTAYEQYYGVRADIHADNNAVVIQVKQQLDPDTCLTLVTPENLEELLRHSLENSGFFGARFRECAGRALLLTRQKFNQRLPLWMNRMHAKELLGNVKSYTDFPILLETWRTCLQDEFDLDQLKLMLAEIRSGEILCTHIASTSPSPFAANISWQQINSQYMYADDTPNSQNLSSLSDELLRSAAFGKAVQLTLSTETVTEFEAKRQRLWAGYAPQSLKELEEWLKERICIPEHEWQALLALLDYETQDSNLLWLEFEGRRWRVHPENAHQITQVWLPEITQNFAALPVIKGETRDAQTLLSESLAFYGPLTLPQLRKIYPIDSASIESLLTTLIDEGTLLSGFWLPDSNVDTQALQFCDTQNFDALLRFERAARRTAIVSKPVTALTAFLADWQGFNSHSNNLAAHLEKLSGIKAPVETWLNDLFIPRIESFSLHTLDTLLDGEGLLWMGTDKQQICFTWDSEIDLVSCQAQTTLPDIDELHSLFKDPHAQYSYNQLLDLSKLSAQDFNAKFWAWVWAGKISSNNMAALDKALAMKFSLPAPAETGIASNTRVQSRVRRAHSRRIRSLSMGWPGQWRLLAPADTITNSSTDNNSLEEDPLTRLEDNKQRVRMLLDRYGILCREIINREGEPFIWSQLFRCMRLMELAGELVGGLFFEGLSGPQFASPQAMRKLSLGFKASSFWISALDPISPCGLGINWQEQGKTLALPHRRRGNYLAFNAGELALCAEKFGARLHFYLKADDAALDTCFPLIRHLLSLHSRIDIESINGESARQSPYLEQLAQHFKTSRDHKGLSLFV